MANSRPATNRSGPPSPIRQIKDRVSMEDLLGDLGSEISRWRPQNAGGWRTCSCPSCGHATAGRFTDGEDLDGKATGRFACHACDLGITQGVKKTNQGIDQIDLVIHVGKAKDVNGAVEWFDKEFGLHIARATKKGTRKARRGPRGDTKPPYPEDWPSPEEWTQDQWDRVHRDWMPVARAAITPKDGRPSLGRVYRILQQINELDELDVQLRQIITYAIREYDPEIAGFTTWLWILVRRRVIDWLKTLDRANTVHLDLVADNPAAPFEQTTTGRPGGLKQLRVPFPEDKWADLIDWRSTLDAAEEALGPEYALLMTLRVSGDSQQDAAEILGMSRKKVRDMEAAFKEWYLSIQGEN